MAFQYSPYILPLLAASALSVWVIYYSFRHRKHSTSAVIIASVALAITWWLLSYALEIAGADLETKLFWGKLQYLGIAYIPYGWFLFAYVYVNQGKLPNQKYIYLLAIIPILTILLAFTTEKHGIIWKTIDVQEFGAFSALSLTYGLGFWIYSAYSYVLLLAGTALIIRSLRQTKGIYRGQAALLILGVTVPWLGNVIYLSGLSPIPNLDLTPFAFTISLAALALGVLGYQLGSISPIARDLVVENMSEGMIVINDRNRITDINPAAGHMIGIPHRDVIGKPLRDVLAPWPQLINRFADVVQATEHISIGEGEAQRLYEIRIAPLYNRQDFLAGRLITLQEITSGVASQIRYAPQETIQSVPPEQEIDLDEKQFSTNPFVNWIISFILTPVKTDLQIPPHVNPKWYQVRERSFTLILRVASIVGTLALFVAPSFSNFTVGLPFAIIIALLWFLGLARQINFNIRTITFLLLVYGLAFIETYQFGYSVESIMFFMTLVVTAVLLLDLNGGLIFFGISIFTLTVFGLQIGRGAFIPVSAFQDVVMPATVQRAITALIVFSASSAALLASASILMKSVNRAWQLESQALNLLQRERDSLEQRVTERTSQLAEARDIALQSNAELRKYFLAIEQSGSAIIITDANGTIEYSNPRFSELTGYSAEEAKGQNPNILQSGKQDAEFYKNMWETITAGLVWHGEFHNRRKDGSLFWESAVLAPLMNDEGEIINYVAIKEDITTKKELQEQLFVQNKKMAKEIADRIQAETQLQESEARFRQIVENASDMIYRTDQQGQFTYLNPTAVKILGLKSDAEMIGKSYLEAIAPSAKRRARRFYLRQFQSGEANTYLELPIITQDGREIWIGQNVQIIHRDGKIAGFQAVARDITDIKQAQEALALARDQALEANELKSQFLAKVSHELRTPLGSMLGYAELLKDGIYGPLQAEQIEVINSIIENTNYQSRMVNELLDEAQIASKSISLQMNFFSPETLLQEIHTRMTVLAEKKQLSFLTEIVEPFPKQLYGDPQRIQQIIINLVGNAIKFTESGEVQTKFLQPDNERWRIQVSDTGAGVPTEAQEVIFEPFRQVSNDVTSENRGTGLGLAITKQLVELMDGEINLESEVGKGSTFTITLPIIQQSETNLPLREQIKK